MNDLLKDSEIYEQLADALDRLPNGFPRTPSKLEIQILKKNFMPELAGLASQLTGTYEQAEIVHPPIDFPAWEQARSEYRSQQHRL